MATKNKEQQKAIAVQRRAADGAVSLKVLAERKEVEGISKRTAFNVSPLALETVEGFNGRPISRERVEYIKAAKRGGAIFPDTIVWVEDGHIYIIAGHHRNVADRELIAEGFPILVTPCTEFKGNAAERIVLMMGDNDGNPLSPLELGIKYKELHGVCGWTISQIAKARGRSTQHVSDLIALANSDGDVQAMVKRGEVSAAVALQTVKKERGGAAKALADGLANAKARGKTKMTPKNLQSPDAVARDKLGASFVADVKQRAKVAKSYLQMMMESASFTDEIKISVRTVLDFIKGEPIPAPPAPKGNSVHTESAIAHIWLRGLLDNPLESSHRKAAAGFLVTGAARGAYVMPTVMSIVEAINAERLSHGELMAETLCPEHAEMITYLRSTGVK